MRQLCVLFLAASASLAHDVSYSMHPATGAAAIRWTYAGTDPVRFAAISIYSPADGTKEYQTGHTDTNGAFAFVPDRPGQWKVVLDDEEGHRAEALITVDASGVATAPNTGQPLWQKWLVGISLIAGITGSWLGWRARQE